MNMLAILEKAFHAAMVEQRRAQADLDALREKYAGMLQRREFGDEVDAVLHEERRASIAFEVASVGSCVAYGRLLDERERAEKVKAGEVIHA